MLAFEIEAAGRTYGNDFRVTTYGEPHGGGVGCIIDGCPPRLPLAKVEMQVEFHRRLRAFQIQSQAILASAFAKKDYKKAEAAASRFVAATQPINALAFVFDGINFGASDFAYSAYSMPNIKHILTEAQNRWLRPAEICEILRNYQKFQIASQPPNRPIKFRVS
ncbi:chorismate synthase 2 [Quercus suber]|uniref:chorismate synthase n=1 Tax=Quercus suber TaxID=58331 RepID=A0AAW0KQJ3_QUESU